MKIYFDESRNTGEIWFKDGKLNYYEQRYFILCGYIGNAKITKKYSDFVEKNIKVIVTQEENPVEIKGNDLLTRVNNKVLEEFIDEFIYGNHFYLNIYDKKYFLVSQMLIWLFGIQFRDTMFIKYHTFCELLHKLNDEFLIQYLIVTKNNKTEQIEKFVEYLLDYPYSECINEVYEKKFVDDFKKMVLESNKHKDYIELLENFNVENVRLSGNERNNIVNLTALGETILLVKENNKEILINDLQIYHDEIELIDKYLEHYLVGHNLSFVDSKKNIGVQLTDNLSSIIGNLINKILPMSSNQKVLKVLSNNFTWQRNTLSKIMNLIDSHNVKIVSSMREQAFLKTIINNPSMTDFEVFRLHFQNNLESRMITEIQNYKDLSYAEKVLNR